MEVHYVCIGNSFRSRLAAAYFNFLKVPGYQAVSSGVLASENLNGPICPYTKKILEENNITVFDKESWTQTEQILIDKSDIVVFMNKYCRDFCLNILGCDLSKKNTYTWDINDVNDVLSKDDLLDNEKVTSVAYQIYDEIKKHVDKLKEECTQAV